MATGASSRTEHDGSITVIARQYDGKRLNSPNDVVVKSDGSIWFTDPAYGIDSDYEGHKSESEIGACHVYRVDPASGEVRIVADDFVRPNGIAFSLDETRLYVADTGASHVKDGPRHIRVFDVSAERQAFRRKASSPIARAERSTVSGSTRRAASGRAPATASIATIRTAR